MKTNKVKNILVYLLVVIFLFLAGYGYYNYYFVFSSGVKAGELNYIVKKGFIWKTNEGRLIQAGYKSGNQNSIQSNEFRFSVTSEAIMHKLENSSGQVVQLHYNEYLGMLPWRGMSTNIVDSVISQSPAPVNKGPLQ